MTSLTARTRWGDGPPIARHRARRHRDRRSRRGRDLPRARRAGEPASPPHSALRATRSATAIATITGNSATTSSCSSPAPRRAGPRAAVVAARRANSPSSSRSPTRAAARRGRVPVARREAPATGSPARPGRRARRERRRAARAAPPAGRADAARGPPRGARRRRPAHDLHLGHRRAAKGAVLTHANCFWTNLSLSRTLDLGSDRRGARGAAAVPRRRLEHPAAAGLVDRRDGRARALVRPGAGAAADRGAPRHDDDGRAHAVPDARAAPRLRARRPPRSLATRRRRRAPCRPRCCASGTRAASR